MLRPCKRSVNPTIDYGRPVDVTADDNDVKKGGKTRQKEREEEEKEIRRLFLTSGRRGHFQDENPAKLLDFSMVGRLCCLASR